MNGCLGLLRTVLLGILLIIARPDARAQGTISIIGPPNGTRITDCETGQPIGSGYSAAIYWAPSSVNDPNAFLQLGATMPIINGQLSGGNRTIAGAAGPTINVFGAAWQTAAGSTYEAASQVPGAKVGRSAIVTAALDGSPVRIPDFQVCPVPEPSTLGLAAAGLLTLLLRARLSRNS